MGATFLTRIWSPVSVEAVVPKVLILLGVSVVDVVLKLILLLKSNKSYEICFKTDITICGLYPNFRDICTTNLYRNLQQRVMRVGGCVHQTPAKIRVFTI